MDILQKIEALGIVPVVKINRAEQAVPLCKALCAGGLPVAEITFRTECAAQAIQAARAALPDMLLGAGTVLTTGQVQSAMEAGAQFIVTPGFNPEVVDFCLEKGIAVFPGCPTTSDMEQAIARGLKVVKFFPAEAMGGLKFIKAVSAPYGQLKFMPTGGVNESNLIDYLAFDKVVACGGSWMVPGDLVEKGAFDEIERLTRSAVQKMLGFEIKHVGVNTESPAAGLAAARRFETLFGWKLTGETEGGVFCDRHIEVIKGRGRGEMGHIGVACNFPHRAKAYLEALGAEFIPESLEYDAKGKLKIGYLKETIAGFAVHIASK